jgi:hypothetical protein
MVAAALFSSLAESNSVILTAIVLKAFFVKRLSKRAIMGPLKVLNASHVSWLGRHLNYPALRPKQARQYPVRACSREALPSSNNCERASGHLQDKLANLHKGEQRGQPLGQQVCWAA